MSKLDFDTHDCFKILTERDKQAARKKVEKAVQHGRLIKPTVCSYCNEEGGVIHGHHDDYRKPLEVEWLCQPCHQELHKFYNRMYTVLPRPNLGQEQQQLFDYPKQPKY